VGTSATLIDTLLAGDYVIEWRVEDFCGNADVEHQDLSVINTKTPTPVCLNGLSASLVGMDLDGDNVIDTEMFELWASDVDGGSYHSCNNAFVLSFSSDPSETNRVYDCDSIGIRSIELWVTDLETGQQDYCSTFIDIQDAGMCPDQFRVVVEGEVYTEELEKIEEVEVHLGNIGMMDMTQEDGQYEFANMPLGGSYELKPEKDKEYLNGVSTLDIIHISRHILGTKKFETGYKTIAADVDNNENITAVDLIELRKLILGIYDELPDNTSWRFVDAEHNFIDVENPWLTAFPEHYMINNLSSDMAVDFIGVKIGDVNGSVIANATEKTVDTRSQRWALDFEIEEQQVKAGEVYRAKVRSNSYDNVSGFQGTIEFDSEKVEILKVEGKALGITDDTMNQR